MGDIFTKIAKEVWKGAKKAKLYQAATLTKLAPGTRTPGNITGGTNPTPASYKAAGFVGDYNAFEMSNATLVAVGDRKISLYGASIKGGVAPAVNDEVTIGGATYRIRRVTSDPANAVYICQTHGPAVS